MRRIQREKKRDAILITPESRARFRALKREIDDALRVLVQDAVDDGSAEVEDLRP